MLQYSSVQHRLFQGIAVVHQLERKIRSIPVEQAEENFVALPDGQFRHLFLGHPLQHTLFAGVALHHLALPAVSGVQVDEPGHVAPHKGQQSPGAVACQGKAGLLPHLPHKAVLRAFKPFKFAAQLIPEAVRATVRNLNESEFNANFGSREKIMSWDSNADASWFQE